MQTHEIFYPPDNKKEYNDQNIIEAITFISGHLHQFSTICIRYAWYTENCTFYPWSELPASKEAGFRRSQSKDTGFEPAGSLFSCLSG